MKNKKYKKDLKHFHQLKIIIKIKRNFNNVDSRLLYVCDHAHFYNEIFFLLH